VSLKKVYGGMRVPCSDWQGNQKAKLWKNEQGNQDALIACVGDKKC